MGVTHHRRRVGLLAAALLTTAVFPDLPAARAQCTCPAEATEVIGHRGTGVTADGAAYPENTLTAYAQGVAEGATMLELDVQHSADGELVIMHDDTVDRTTDGSGCVGSLTAAELAALDAGGGEHIPTFGELLAAVSADLNVEIKVNEDASCPTTDRDRLAADVAAAIAADPAERRVVISSFDLEQLRAVRAADPTLELAFLTTTIDGFQTAIDEGFAAVHPLSITVRPPEVTRAHEAGLAVRPWTVDDAATMQRLMGMGVDGIITDDPDVLVGAIESYCTTLCTDAGVSLDAGAGPDAGAADASGPDAGGGGGGGCSAVPSGNGSPAWLAVIVALVLYRPARRQLTTA